MKRFAFFLTLAVSCYSIYSQVPQGFNYQAIARDLSNNPITTNLQVRIGFQFDTLSSAFIWEELHSTVKPNSTGLFSLVIGSGSRVSGVPVFSDIDWATGPIYLKTFIYYNSSWKYMGAARLWSVPYSIVSGALDGSPGKLEVVGDDVTSDEALFEVKRKDGQTMFAVYNHGVRVYMPLDTLSKARKGGFAIGGFDKAKGVIQEYFVVNPDSIRAYIDTNPAKARKGGFAIGGFDKAKLGNEEYLRVTRDSTRIYLNGTGTKARKGGFAIGGFDKAKGNIQDFMTVSSDSIRMFIDDTPGKARKGGFAIGGFDKAKAGNESFLNVATDAGGIINPSQNRILWYPLKNAFLTGKVLIEKPDSVGVNSFASGYESKAVGQFSQALGYKAIARGDYSTSIGRNAIANKINSFAFGENAHAMNQDSYAFGAFSEATGIGSFAFGYVGRDSLGPTGKKTIASGNYSFAFGLGSQATSESAFAFGADNLASNYFSMAFGLSTKSTGGAATTFGFKTQASSWTSMAIGMETQASGDISFAGGYQSQAIGSSAIAFGHNAQAIGDNSSAFGAGTQAIGVNSTVIGLDSKTTGGMAFAGGELSNASGIHSFAFGYKANAMSWESVALGASLTASGGASMAINWKNVASGDQSFAGGQLCNAIGYQSFAFGNQSNAIGNISVALGYKTKAVGANSLALGFLVKARPFASLVIGQYNDTSCVETDWWTGIDPVFVIGNGSSEANRTNAFTVLQNGRTSIGLSTPTQMLDVNGNARFRAVGSGAFAYNLNIMSDGTLTTATSDISMKENIFPISDALSCVTKLRGVFFTWKNDSTKTKQIGMIAQEVEPIVPEIVFTNPVDGLKGINYSQTSALLVEAIKEQQKQIASQQKEIDELKALVNVLMSNQTNHGNK